MGSHTNNGVGGGRGKICLLSVQLASSDGNLFGGAVAGSLVAGGPTQVISSTSKLLHDQINSLGGICITEEKEMKIFMVQ